MAIFGRKNKDTSGPSPAPPAAAVEELNPAEAQWVQSLLDELSAAGVDPSDLGAVQRHYDETYAAWAALPEDGRPDPNPTINRVGAALGQHLSGRTGLRWVIATDEYGTELALHGQPGDVLVFPPNMVGKRWSAGETGFLVGLADFTAQRAGELRGR